MRDKLKQIQTRYDGLTLRERILVFLVVVAVTFTVWNAMLFGPLEERSRRQLGEAAKTDKQTKLIALQVSALKKRRSFDPDAQGRRRIAALRNEDAQLRDAFAQLTGNLVPPERMAELLESMLSQDVNLTLTHVEGLGATPALDAAPSAGAVKDTARASDSGALYKHGLRLDFRGGYLDTLEYFQNLEGLPLRVLWDSVDYRVDEYPTASVSITVYSLSLDADWIGV
jgi:MSHA biogenesis protein MshJ